MSSKRLSRDHHDTEGFLTTSLAPKEIPPRDIAAEVFNSWLASTYALTPSATIADLMKSCTDYVSTDVDKDSLGGLLDFDKTRGFKRRMDAAKVKSGARIIRNGKFWTIKNIFSVSPESKRWQQTLHKATVAKLYDDRKLLKVRNHSCIKIQAMVHIKFFIA
jgi:hypothetical protein